MDERRSQRARARAELALLRLAHQLRDDDAYLERDIPQLGPRIPAETLRRLWTMLAHHQGGLLNAAQLARNLGVSGVTATRYLDLMVDLLLVRRLAPDVSNVGKRLVRSPKVYLRDSGLLHALRPDEAFIVYPGSERYPLGPALQAIGLPELCDKAQALGAIRNSS